MLDARRVYTWFLYCLTPFVVLRLFWLGLRYPRYRERWRERFGHIRPLPGDRPVIWVHAVSVGEVQASVPLVNRLLESFPEHQVLVTTTTPTGMESVQQRFGKEVAHRYLPYDIPAALRRFLRGARPAILIVMETELWPNLFRVCREQGVPVIVANARMSQRSAEGYRRFAVLTRSMLSDVAIVAAQSGADAERIISLGAPAERVLAVGNLKFDLRLPPSLAEQGESWRRKLTSNRQIWIAASTHDGEERQVLDAYARMRAEGLNCLLILAPRHPERFSVVTELCRRQGFRVLRRTQLPRAIADIDIVILDTLGELPMFYAAADVAFVGGSLVQTGGHNMLEPASLGLPVITGPHYYNFSEVAGLLLQGEAAWVVNDSAELAVRVAELLRDPNLRYNAGQRARRIVQENRGGVDRVIGILEKFLPVSEPRVRTRV
jgi:3-deoxy-D-manno-octulosonic-acid transferase